jgi:hypothetical protein
MTADLPPFAAPRLHQCKALLHRQVAQATFPREGIVSYIFQLSHE